MTISDQPDPFWNRAYRDGSSPFGKPSEEVVRLAAGDRELIAKGARILVAGCGDGRHALYLAKEGFVVDAFDISPDAVAHVRANATPGLHLRAWQADLDGVELADQYDWVIAHGMLHMVPDPARDKAMARLRAQTHPGGIHVVAVFTDTIPPPPDLAPLHVALFSEGELFEQYRAAGWELLETRSYVLEDEHPGGIRHRHPINKLVARAPAPALP